VEHGEDGTADPGPPVPDDAKVVIALASRLGDTKRPSLSPTEWSRFAAAMADRRIAFTRAFDPEFDGASIPGPSESIIGKIDALLRSAAAATVEVANLEGFGVRTLTIVNDAYPHAFWTRLGCLAPPVIHIVGDANLVTGEGTGIVGSRNVREEGAEVAR